MTHMHHNSIFYIILLLLIKIEAAHRNASHYAPIEASAHAGRLSSFPYISGDTFRNYADFIYDETQQNFRPDSIKPGNVIFVKTDLLNDFFKQKHPYIPCRYILLTHNSDYLIPGPYAHMLNDPKIIAWFGQNVENYNHPRLHPIPIGIANQYWAHGDIKVFKAVQQRIPHIRRRTLLYMNFEIGTNIAARGPVYHLFKDKPFCKTSGPQPLYNYLLDLAQAKFVLSPRGNGIDCHRTWEAAYMGAIPIVMSSACDQLYDNMPVVIVKSWTEVTEAFLNKKYEEITQKSYNNHERLYAQYWFDIIDEYKKQG